MITLLPHFEVIVTSKDNARGHAIMVTDYGPEASKLWGIVLQNSGEFWEVPTNEIRFAWNWSLERRRPAKTL